ncbi:hypothetical protein IPN41_04345 [Candidatus Falkowbacteria bacterium]|nr:MAG: hypothetical protein IPN41_04345 [Candidatus Falkowbacteria bacterium]
MEQKELYIPVYFRVLGYLELRSHSNLDVVISVIKCIYNASLLDINKKFKSLLFAQETQESSDILKISGETRLMEDLHFSEVGVLYLLNILQGNFFKKIEKATFFLKT